MQPLPPHVQARVDELVAAAPPLDDEQKAVIRRALMRPRPVPQPAAREPQAA
jgi:hypothetical protein